MTHSISSHPLASIPLVSIQNIIAEYYSRLHKQYLPVLYGVSLDIMPGEKIVLIGKSGSGKSTLLSCISGLKVPTQGEIIFNGKPIRYKDNDLRQHWRRVPTIDQDAKSLLWFHTIANNIAKTMILGEIPRRLAEEKTLSYLDKVGLIGKKNCYPQELSGGERQRAVIAKALAMGGELLLADEPVSSLDMPIARKILDLLKNLPCAVLLVTHLPSHVADFCDRMFVLHNHRLFDITNVKQKRRDLLANFKDYSDLVNESNQLRFEKKIKPFRIPTIPFSLHDKNRYLNNERGRRRCENTLRTQESDEYYQYVSEAERENRIVSGTELLSRYSIE